MISKKVIRCSILFIFSLITSSSYSAIQDFCVGDLSGPETPTGFACKNPTSVTIKDFVYSKLASPRNFSSVSADISTVLASVDQFPGLNSHGLSLYVIEMDVGGVRAMHTHPTSSELVVMVSGSMSIGIISSDNKVYSTTLKEGDLVVFPQGLLHYLYNAGDTKAFAYAYFNNPKPAIQFVHNAFFGNDLPTDVLARVTFLETNQIKKLKGAFGGTN